MWADVCHDCVIQFRFLSLHKEQAGVGMGLMQMLNFISAGMASVYGKMLDIQSGIHWNPVHFYTEGTSIAIST